MFYTNNRRVEKISCITICTEQLVNSFQNKVSTLQSTLFLKSLISAEINWDNYIVSVNWNWSSLSTIELVKACFTISVKGKTPESDKITQAIIAKVYKAISDLFYKLYSSLLNTEYYSNCWKQVTEAILRKLNKLNHSILKAYRVISLQNCLNKVSKQILARRLFYLTETTSLLQSSQIDGRLSKSAIDAALLLLKEVDQNKK